MPEYAELHSTSHAVNEASCGHKFVRCTVHLDWSLPSSLEQDVDTSARRVVLPGTEGWDGFELVSRHRGKECCLALRPVAPGQAGRSDGGRALLAPSCPTCEAVARSGAPKVAPTCRHGEACVKLTVRKAGPNRGRSYWGCPNEGRRRCNTFAWATRDVGEVALSAEGEERAGWWFPHEAGFDPVVRRAAIGKAAAVRPDEAETAASDAEAATVATSVVARAEIVEAEAKTEAGAEAEAEADGAGRRDVLTLTLRRGMHGRVQLLRDEETEEPEGTHLSFVRDDGCRLCFVDHRVRTTRTAIWNFGQWGGPWRRGPDPVHEFDAFATRALALLGGATALPDAARLLGLPLCELLLDQRIFNGVGNYLRAEIIYTARLPPFVSARHALELAAAAHPHLHHEPQRPSRTPSHPSPMFP